MKKYIAETCTVTSEAKGQTVVADVLNFQEEKYLSVSLNKSVKLNLQWNGRVYEGKMAGMTFVSSGPTITEIKHGR